MFIAVLLLSALNPDGIICEVYVVLRGSENALNPFTPFVDIVQKEQYKAGGMNLMIVPQTGNIPAFSSRSSITHTCSDATEGSNFARTYKNCVQTGSSKYSLKITVPSAKKEHITGRYKKNGGSGIFTYKHEGAGGGTGEYTWYIVDNSGNPVDWTGYFTVYGVASHGKVHIPPSFIMEETRMGSYMSKKASPKYSGYTMYVGSKGYDGSATVDEALNFGVTLKIHIPISGIPINITNASPAQIYFSAVEEIVSASSLTNNKGEWTMY